MGLHENEPKAMPQRLAFSADHRHVQHGGGHAQLGSHMRQTGESHSELHLLEEQHVGADSEQKAHRREAGAAEETDR